MGMRWGHSSVQGWHVAPRRGSPVSVQADSILCSVQTSFHVSHHLSVPVCAHTLHVHTHTYTHTYAPAPAQLHAHWQDRPKLKKTPDLPHWKHFPTPFPLTDVASLSVPPDRAHAWAAVVPTALLILGWSVGQTQDIDQKSNNSHTDNT